MKILFSVNHFGFLRNFEPALRVLAERGHSIHLLAERRESIGGISTAETLADEYSTITYGFLRRDKGRVWYVLSTWLRLCLDYWRYLDPRFVQASKLRSRAASQAPRFAVSVAQIPVVGHSFVQGLRWIWAVMESIVPPGHEFREVLERDRPDVLLLTPLLYFGSQQVDFVRSARLLGIPSVLGVGSWDHLTTKGAIHEIPDHVVVWNEEQRREAAELHEVPMDRVKVTGAQAYDRWFNRRPSTSWRSFCDKVSLPLDRPLLLYVCSSPFIAPNEVGLVRSWVKELRSSPYQKLRTAGLLIRPHPQNAEQWRDESLLAGIENVTIWPRHGANPVAQEARADYFDSMYYSAAVVGVNTSALIESGVIGRSVYTILTDEFSGTQEGTLHFQHLKTVNGGLLHVASNLREHAEQLARHTWTNADPKSLAFVKAFVRPNGLNTPAGKVFADTLEAMAKGPTREVSGKPLIRFVCRSTLYPIAALAKFFAGRRRVSRGTQSRAPGQKLKVLFVMQSPEYLRYYDSTVLALSRKGVHVSVGVIQEKERKQARLNQFEVSDERISVLGIVPTAGGVLAPFASAVRGTQDFLRYLHPRYSNAPVLRDRMKRKVLPRPLRWLDRFSVLDEVWIQRALRLLKWLERMIPTDRRIKNLLDEEQPDAVIVSPLVDAASPQVDFIKAAKALGIRTAACIASWDNLTNKGLLRVEPDRVVVWNEIQRNEAVQMHGFPPDKVIVTGAQLFDRWFDRRPTMSRAEFCERVGLPTKPFLLFVGSSPFIAGGGREVPFVQSWLRELRSNSDPSIRDIGVLIRPHPYNADEWRTVDLSGHEDVSIWPKLRFNPVDEENRSVFFDSLHHSVAAVGINTSAMIEAAIVGRPVLSILTTEFSKTQQGTLHFHYLRPENGGFLRVAENLSEHVKQVVETIKNGEQSRGQIQRFVGSFIRPHGVERPVTPIVVDALHDLACQGPVAPERISLTSGFLRLLVLPIVVAVTLVPRCIPTRKILRRVAWRMLENGDRWRRILYKRMIVRPRKFLRRCAGYAWRLTRRSVHRSVVLIGLSVRIIVRWLVLKPFRAVFGFRGFSKHGKIQDSRRRNLRD